MWGIDPTATTGREWPAYPGLSLTRFYDMETPTFPGAYAPG